MSLLKRAQTGSADHPASHSIDIGVLALGYSGRGFILTPHVSLVPRLRMNGAKPPLPLYDYLLKNLKQVLMKLQYTYIKLHGLSPRANYTDRAAAAGRRS